MGPGILLCPSPSASHLWRHKLPPLKPRQKEGVFPGTPRCLAVTSDMTARPRSCVYNASSSDKCTKYLAWRRVAAASASSEVSVEESSVGGNVAVSEADHAMADAVQEVADVGTDVVDLEKNVSDVEQGATDAQQRTLVEDVDQDVVDAAQNVVDAVESIASAAQSVDDGEQAGADPKQTASDTEHSIPDSLESVVGETSSGNDAILSIAAEASTAISGEGTPTAPEKTRTRRTLSRSNSKKNVVVSPAELVPGAQFLGKVVSIQSFGAFVDFGAFTNGLVHISRLSKSYVQKVGDVVQVGQEVKVQLLEVDFEARRISLMLLQEAVQEDETEEAVEGEKMLTERPQQQPRTPRRDPSKKPSATKPANAPSIKVGETVSGFVKNMIKSGVFISLPNGTDGYLPVQEVMFKGSNTNLETQFQVGEEITVRVLRMERGRVNLTMRKEVNLDKINEDLNKGVMVTGTNPFELAFRKNEAIASYLAERDKLRAQGEAQTQEVNKEAAAGLN